MKKNIFFSALFLGLMTTALTAQRSANGAIDATHFDNRITVRSSGPRVENDTLFGAAFALPCGDQITSFFSNNWGFISGTNGYTDFEKAQRITLGAGNNFTVQEIWGFFAAASEVNNGPLRAKVYSTSAGGAPTTELGVSADINVSDIDTSSSSLVPTIFTFATPPAVTGPEIFISIDFEDLYASQDTVGLWMTADECGDGNDAYELWGDGSGWFPLDSPDSWGLETNLLIGVVVAFDPISSQSPEPVAGMNGLRIFPASPNPTSADLNINYQLDQSSKLQIEIYATDGKLLQRIDKGIQPSGRFTEILNTEQFPAGAYVYGVITETARLMNRFVVE